VTRHTHSHPDVDHYDLGRQALLAHIADHLHILDQKVGTLMATQAELDATVQQIRDAVTILTTESTELTTATAAIVAWIAANPGVNTAGLTDAVATLVASTDAMKAAADAAEAAVPAPPA
jgi:hypothetical protein